LPVVSGFSGLVYDGTDLFFGVRQGSNPDEMRRFTLSTDTVGDAMAGFTPQFVFPHAVQGSDFWVLCACGGDNPTRRDPTGAIQETIDVSALLSGDSFSPNTMAFDGTDLLIFGYNYTKLKYQMVEVTGTAGAHTLVRTVDMAEFVSAATWDGTSLWVLGWNDRILKLDPTTLLAQATYEDPLPTASWYGIAAVGADLYLIGTSDFDGPTVVVKVTP
jgi:hypothetical protein